jgi:hypothetical protein
MVPATGVTPATGSLPSGADLVKPQDWQAASAARFSTLQREQTQ